MAAIYLGGCRKDSEERTSQTGPAAGEKNELVELRYRQARDEDRITVRGAGGNETAWEHEGPRETEEVAEEITKLEPGVDWRSERLSAAAANQLRRSIVDAAVDVTA
ncbi:MAG: hypothetical protein GWO24_18560, partial [Akkermansiaceae bacterium]|nr:hypothetical protein [Akkermansiaceae bacterium]